MKILSEDKDVLVCIKEAGELSERREGKPGKSVEDIYGSPLYTVHRLDRKTAGVTVYAKTPQAAALLSGQIRNGETEKRYFAVLRGEPVKESEELTDYLVRDEKRNLTSVADENTEGAKFARLQYETAAVNQGLTLVKVRLLTGRTHQIRVQFSSRGTPVYGDSRYSGGRGELALYSYLLEFNHPQTAERMRFTGMPDTEKFPWNLFEREVSAI